MISDMSRKTPGTIVSALDLDLMNTEMKLGCFNDKALLQRTKFEWLNFKTRYAFHSKVILEGCVS